MLLQTNCMFLPNRAITKICIKIQQERRRTYNVKKWHVPRPLLPWKPISNTYFECGFVALVIQHAMSMRRLIMLCVACLTEQYFFTLCQKGYYFRKKEKKCNWTQNVCFDFLYKFSRNICHSKKNWAKYSRKFVLVFM